MRGKKNFMKKQKYIERTKEMKDPEESQVKRTREMRVEQERQIFFR
jgi:hypothetical protein